jgi:hypothetical protein
MAEETIATPVVETPTQADPSPAPTANEDFSQAALDSMTPTQRAEWKATGELPAKSADSATAVKPESAPAPDAGKDKQEPSPGTKEFSPAEKRIRQLHAESKAANERAARLERELNELRTAKPEVKAAPAAEEKKEPTFTRPRPTAQDIKPDGTPKYSDYDEYSDALMDWKLEQREAANAAREAEREGKVKNLIASELTEAQKREAQAKENEKWAEGWNGQVSAAKEKHGDFDDVVKAVMIEFDDKGQPIPAPGQIKISLNGPIDAFCARSPHGAEILYHLASNPDEIERIQSIPDPWAAGREIALLEFKLFNEVPGEKKEKKEAPAPKITKQSDPIKPVSGTNTAPEDEEMAAVEAGDMRKFKRLANARDAAARKG